VLLSVDHQDAAGTEDGLEEDAVACAGVQRVVGPAKISCTTAGSAM